MRQDFTLKEGVVTEAGVGDGNISVYTNPSADEKRELLESLRIDEHTLASALDADEISRIECDGEQTFIIWKRPNNVSLRSQQMFEVSSIGMFLRPDRLTLGLALWIMLKRFIDRPRRMP